MCIVSRCFTNAAVATVGKARVYALTIASLAALCLVSPASASTLVLSGTEVLGINNLEVDSVFYNVTLSATPVGQFADFTQAEAAVIAINDAINASPSCGAGNILCTTGAATIYLVLFPVGQYIQTILSPSTHIWYVLGYYELPAPTSGLFANFSVSKTPLPTLSRFSPR